ncbi:MAG TPA: M20/M25/M40 family metallo-hydrolase [Geobacterales bacterium]|nr:M20/M25/M40 family metallo-hydrolase [Geobacterales bacterium]
MEPIKTLEEFLKIYSPSGNEEKAIDFLKDLFSEFGIETTIIEGNLIARIGKGYKKVLLCGHVDTVPGIIPFKKEDDIIFARGSVDAKTSLLALIFAALKKDYNLELKIACVIGEESENPGILKINKELLKSDYAIFGEPSNLDGVVIGYRGRVALKITCRTSKAHASKEDMNAIKEIVDLLKKLEELNQIDVSKSINSITVNPVLIEGGIANNVIPDFCKAIVDVRIPIGINALNVKNKILEIITSKNSLINIEWLSECDPVLANKSSPLVFAFKKSIAKMLKRKPRIVIKSGSSDMNYFAKNFNLNCISYGPGNPRYEHTDEEHVSIKDFLKSIEIISQSLSFLSEL